MPTYEYACSACGRRSDVLHGVHDSAPTVCPACGAAGTLRKAFAAPAIVFKGTGWAKKERRSSPSSAKTRDGGDDTGTGAAKGAADAGGDTAGSGSGDKAAAASSTSGTTPAETPTKRDTGGSAD